MDVLIQNTGATPLFMTLTDHKNGTAGISGRIFFEADGQTTKVPREIYESKIKNNPFWMQKIEAGIIVVLNDVGTKPQEAEQNAAAARELGYARYKNLMTVIKQEGGLESKEISPYLDANGMPKLSLVRSNMGQVEPQKIEEYKLRYLAENANGIDKVVLPANKRSTINSSNIKKEMKKIEEAALVDEPSTEKSLIYSREELEGMDRDILNEIATESKISYSNRTSDEKLINKIVEFQKNN